MPRLLTLLLVLLFPLVVGVFLIGSDPDSEPSAFSAWWQAQQRSAQIQVEERRQRRSHEAISALIVDLGEERLSLRQAAPLMFAHMMNPSNMPSPLRMYYGARSNEEAIERWAMAYLESHLPNNARHAALLHRLRAELRENWGHWDYEPSVAGYVPRQERDF